MRFYGRNELQVLMMRIFRQRTGKPIWRWYDSSVRHFFYAIAWVIEGINNTIQLAITRYHLHRIEDAETLVEYAKEFDVAIEKSGSRAVGKITLYGAISGPGTFSIAPSQVAVVATSKTGSLEYTPIRSESIMMIRRAPGQRPSAVVEYQGPIGSVGNVCVDDPYEWKLKTANVLIEKIAQTSDFIGGDDIPQSVAAIRAQITSKLAGYVRGNIPSLLYAARTVSGVMYADVREEYPAGQTTVFVADNNGLATSSIIQRVSELIDLEYRPIGVSLRYSAAQLYVAKIAIVASHATSAEMTMIRAECRAYIDMQGFAPVVSSEAMKQLHDKIESVRVSCVSPSVIRGVRIVGFTGDVGGVLRYDPIGCRLQFGDGEWVGVGLSGGVRPKYWKLPSHEQDVVLFVSVDPDRLLPFSAEQTVTIGRILQRQFMHGEMLRVSDIVGGIQ